MKKFKKILCVLVAVCVAITGIVFSKASDTYSSDPSIDLLDNILNNRSWVIDTIVNGNYSSNNAIDVQSFDSYIVPVYNRVKDDAVLNTIIHAIDIAYNGVGYLLDYLLTLTDEALEELLDFFDIVNIVFPEDCEDEHLYTCEVLEECISGLANTQSEKHMEYILTGVFSNDYINNDLVALDEEEFTISSLSVYADHFKTANKLIKDFAELGSTTIDEYKRVYTKVFLEPFAGSLNTWFKERRNNARWSFEDRIISQKNLTDSKYTMATLQQMNNDSFAFDQWAIANYQENFLSETNKVLGALDLTASFTSAMFANCVLLESLQSQREFALNSFETLGNYIDDAGAKEALSDYSNLINSEYDTLTISLKSGFDALEETGVIEDVITGAAFTQASNLILNMVDVAKTKFPSALASAGAGLNIGLVLGEVISGTEATAQSFFRVEYAMELIAAMKSAYSAHVSAYKSNKTPANAQRVLNDLMFLKRLRMFTCKMVYESAIHQITTPMGYIITGLKNADEIQGWETMYQDQIDALLCAALDPSQGSPVTVSSGERLVIFADNNYAILQSSNGKNHIICDISDRLLAGLKIYNGEVQVIGDSVDELFIASIICAGNVHFETAAVDIHTLGFVNTGGTLYLKHHANIYTYTVLALSEAIVSTGTGSKIVAYGTLSLEGASMHDSGLVSSGSAYLDDVYTKSLVFNGSGEQKISGTSVITDTLSFENPSGSIVNCTCSIFAFDSVYDPSTPVIAGNKISLGKDGTIIGYHYEGDLALNEPSYSRRMTFGGELYSYGVSSFNNGLKVAGRYYHFGDSLYLGSASTAGDFEADAIDCKYTFDGKFTAEQNFYILNGICDFKSEINSGNYLKLSFCSGTVPKLVSAGSVGINATTFTVDTVKSGTGIFSITGGSDLNVVNVEAKGDVEVDSSTYTVTSVHSSDGSFEVTEDSTVNINKAVCGGDAVVGSSAYTVVDQLTEGNFSATDSSININKSLCNSKTSLDSSDYTVVDQKIKGNFTARNSTVDVDELVCNGKTELNTSVYTVINQLTGLGFAANNSTVNISQAESKSDFLAVGGSVTVPILTVGGDLYFKNVNPIIKDLRLSGSSNQVVSGEALNIENVTFDNTSKSCVEVNTPITVTGIVDNPRGKISGNSCVILQNGGVITDGYFNGTIKLNGYTGEYDELDIKGSLLLAGNGEIIAPQLNAGNLNIESNYTVNSEDIVINNDLVCLSESTINSKDIAINNNLICQSASAINSEFLEIGNELSVSANSIIQSNLIEFGSYKQTAGAAQLLSSKIHCYGNFNHTGGTLTLPENSVFTVDGVAVSTSTINSGGEIFFNNDANLANATADKLLFCYDFRGTNINAGTITLNNKLEQTVSGTRINTNNFLLENDDKGIVKINCPVTVKELFYNNAAAVYGLSNVTMGNLKWDGTSTVDGDYKTTNLVITEDTVLNSSLIATGTVTVAENVKLTILGDMQTSANITVASGAELVVKGSINNSGTITFSGEEGCLINVDTSFVNSGTFTVENQGDSQINIGADFFNTGRLTLAENTLLTVSGDAMLSGTVSNQGSIVVAGDAKLSGNVGKKVTVTGDINSVSAVVDTLILNGTHQQVISGNSVSTTNLRFENDAKGEITVNCPITVSSEFYNNARYVDGLSKINAKNLSDDSVPEVIEGDIFNVQAWNCEKNTEIKCGLNCSESLTVSENVSLIVNGDLTGNGTITLGKNVTLTVNGDLKGGAAITLADGAKVVVKGNAHTTGKVTVSAGAEIVVTDSLHSSGAFANNGTVSVSDALFSGGTVSGNGTFIFTGDLAVKSAKVSGVNAVFESAFAQHISGANISFNNLTFNNTSSDGIVLLSTVNYTGTLEKNSSNITNAENLVG